YPHGTQHAAFSSVVRWDGRVWQIIYEGQWAGTIGSPIVLDRGAGPELYLGVILNSEWALIRWTGLEWVPGPAAFSPSAGWPMLSAQLGGQTDLYGIRSQGNSREVLRWTGEDWDVIGVADWYVTHFAMFDGGTGPSLHVAGSFSSIDGIPLNRIA